MKKKSKSGETRAKARALRKDQAKVKRYYHELDLFLRHFDSEKPEVVKQWKMAIDDLSRITIDARREVISDRARTNAGFPAFWKLFRFALPRKTQTAVFEPLYNEFLEDYLIACRTKIGTWEKVWLRAFWGLRTSVMIIHCIAVGHGAIVMKACAKLIPELIRRIWMK